MTFRPTMKSLNQLVNIINDRLDDQNRYFIHQESGFFSVRRISGAGHHHIQSFSTKREAYEGLSLVNNILQDKYITGPKDWLHGEGR